MLRVSSTDSRIKQLDELLFFALIAAKSAQSEN